MWNNYQLALDGTLNQLTVARARDSILVGKTNINLHTRARMRARARDRMLVEKENILVHSLLTSPHGVILDLAHASL